jgi:hypothetical protein
MLFREQFVENCDRRKAGKKSRWRHDRRLRVLRGNEEEDCRQGEIHVVDAKDLPEGTELTTMTIINIIIFTTIR